MPDQMERLDARLDRLEARLPMLPAAGLRLQRTLASRSCEMATSLARTWWGAVGDTTGRAGTATSTIAGTGRAAGERAADTMATAARQVAGRTRAQVREVGERAEHELTEAMAVTGELVDRATTDATRAVQAATVAADPDRIPTGDAYQDLTKAELYRRATTLDIDGRSKMSKAELITALVDHEQELDRRG